MNKLVSGHAQRKYLKTGLSVGTEHDGKSELEDEFHDKIRSKLFDIHGKMQENFFYFLF